MTQQWITVESEAGVQFVRTDTIHALRQNQHDRVWLLVDAKIGREWHRSASTESMDTHLTWLAPSTERPLFATTGATVDQQVTLHKIANSLATIAQAQVAGLKQTDKMVEHGEEMLRQGREMMGEQAPLRARDDDAPGPMVMAMPTAMLDQVKLVTPFIIDPTLSLESAVYQSLGAASTCWENTKGAGVFLDTLAAAIGEALIAHIQRTTPLATYERSMGDMPVGSLVADMERGVVVHARLTDGWIELPRAASDGLFSKIPAPPTPIRLYSPILAGGQILRVGSIPTEGDQSA